ncbi:MAG: hypothetical protein R6V50_01060 [Thermoplasmatota archaeon]
MSTRFHHIALCYTSKEDSTLFFTKVLGLDYVRSFHLSKDISLQIFGKESEVDVDVFENDALRFEVFYCDKIVNFSFSHVCVEVENQKDFLKKCKQYGISWFFVKKQQKELLFVRDHYNNLYEIKTR